MLHKILVIKNLYTYLPVTELGSPVFALYPYSHFRKRLCHICGLVSI